MHGFFQDHLTACRRTGQQCHQALQVIATLQGRAGPDEALAQWERLFASLRQESERYARALESGLFLPPGLYAFLNQGLQALTGFAGFLHQYSVPKEVSRMVQEGSVPIGKHTLPPLPYSYDALEPYIDTQTMHLHHDKHHLAYVNGLNKAEEAMAEARASGDFDLIKHWEREAAFHGAGHYLHTIFWKAMTPNGGGDPDGDLAAQIASDFGSVSAFKSHFAAAAEKVEGVGWAILVWSPRPRRLEILQAERHQLLSQWDVVPLLPLDVWEHAYYLKYNNDRKAYIDAWWHVVNWQEAADRFEKARTLQWEPY